VTKAAQKIRRWRTDPVSYVLDNFNPEIEPWQVDALRAIGGDYDPYRRVCLKAATGVGKSALLAWAGWHRLTCFARPGQHPKGAALSCEGFTNLQDNLWAELSKWQQRSPFLMSAFTWTQRRIYATQHGETWFLAARSYPKNANAETIGTSLSGLHSEFPFILLDETGAGPVALGQKAEQIFTGGVRDALIIQAGNPTSTDGLLYASARAEDQKVITITADPDDPKRSSRVDIDHARAMIAKYTRGNAWVKATILGEFPDSAVNALLSLDEVERAMNRFYRDPDLAHSQKRLGIDVARFGLDSTVIFPRQGLQAFNPVEMRGARSNEIAARVALAKSKWESELEFVDDTGGFGSGVVDSLIQAGHAPVPVNFSGAAQEAKFLNCRAEMWWRMAEWVKRGGAIPGDLTVMKKELTTPTYTFNQGKFQLEPKELIKKRLGFSPDHADGLCLTFFYEEQPAGSVLPRALQHLARPDELSDYNPFSKEHGF
jgi:hypothetical protein